LAVEVLFVGFRAIHHLSSWPHPEQVLCRVRKQKS